MIEGMRQGATTTRIHFAHTLLRARDYQDRPEFHQLCDWWRERKAGVCALVGIGGAGKTAVADRFLRVLPDAIPCPQKSSNSSTPIKLHQSQAGGCP